MSEPTAIRPHDVRADVAKEVSCQRKYRQALLLKCRGQDPDQMPPLWKSRNTVFKEVGKVRWRVNTSCSGVGSSRNHREANDTYTYYRL